MSNCIKKAVRNFWFSSALPPITTMLVEYLILFSVSTFLVNGQLFFWDWYDDDSHLYRSCENGHAQLPFDTRIGCIDSSVCPVGTDCRPSPDGKAGSCCLAKSPCGNRKPLAIRGSKNARGNEGFMDAFSCNKEVWKCPRGFHCLKKFFPIKFAVCCPY